MNEIYTTPAHILHYIIESEWDSFIDSVYPKPEVKWELQ